MSWFGCVDLFSCFDCFILFVPLQNNGASTYVSSVYLHVVCVCNVFCAIYVLFRACCRASAVVKVAVVRVMKCFGVQLHVV